MLSLGEYHLVGLADARKARYQAKILLDDGINPSQNRKQEKTRENKRKQEKTRENKRKQEKIEAQYLSVNTFKLT